MIKRFICDCGNKDPKKAYAYDGCLGYEAIVCTCCGRYYDFDEQGKFRKNQPDDWSKQFVNIVADVVTKS
jgi:hypothetical protein